MNKQNRSIFLFLRFERLSGTSPTLIDLVGEDNHDQFESDFQSKLGAVNRVLFTIHFFLCILVQERWKPCPKRSSTPKPQLTKTQRACSFPNTIDHNWTIWAPHHFVLSNWRWSKSCKKFSVRIGPCCSDHFFAYAFIELSRDDECLRYWNRYLILSTDGTDGSVRTEQANLNTFTESWLNHELRIQKIYQSERYVRNCSFLKKFFFFTSLNYFLVCSYLPIVLLGLHKVCQWKHISKIDRKIWYDSFQFILYPTFIFF